MLIIKKNIYICFRSGYACVCLVKSFQCYVQTHTPPMYIVDILA